MHSSFRRGLRQGLSIALGYLSVSFSFGIMSVQAGFTVTEALMISVTNLTSAGQVAGISLIAAGASYLELFLAELTINIRYALMSLALSQKTDAKFTLPHRLLAAYGITDEIFAVASLEKEPVTPRYMYGLILIASLGWFGGTWLGAAAGTLLPAQLANALNIALYGMFIAIFVPASRKSRGVLAVVLCAGLISAGLYYFVKIISGGFAMMIAAILAAVLGAIFFPAEPEKEETA